MASMDMFSVRLGLDQEMGLWGLTWRATLLSLIMATFLLALTGAAYGLYLLVK